MSDQQALQDREKQIATLRELRKRRHEERPERPPRLLRGLDLRGHPKAANEGHLKTGQRK